MRIESLAIADVKLITPEVFRDERGFFCETWNARALETAGISASFVQDNQAYSRKKGTVRGLHFQTPPAAQGKLIRVVRGAILDVAVDVRRGSATFGHHVTAVLSAENWAQLWVPMGFAHGYVTREADTQILYKVTACYSPAHEAGVAWNDPALGIDWGIAPSEALLADRDRKLPRLSELPTPS